MLEMWHSSTLKLLDNLAFLLATHDIVGEADYEAVTAAELETLKL